jgi:DNA polymerase-1
MSKKDVFVIIDGNALLHRAYHAYPLTLRTSKGELVNAVYGFSRLLIKVISDLKPDYLAVAFDTAAPTFRHLDYAGYKAHRPKMDDELAGQLDRLKEIVSAFGVESLAVDGFEADDIIGTISEEIDKSGLLVDTYIVTGDMDALQLIDGNTFVYSPTKGLSNPKIWAEADVVGKYGFGPESVVDYKALRGDPSDNIPGVRGIGEKTAKALISEWGSLDKIYKNINKVKPQSVQKKLAEDAETASLSRNLATIKRDVPVTVNLEACRFEELEKNGVLKSKFKEMEFKSLLKSISVSTSVSTPTSTSTSKSENENQLELL